MKNAYDVADPETMQAQMDSGELDSDEDTYEMIRGIIEREFDLP